MSISGYERIPVDKICEIIKVDIILEAMNSGFDNWLKKAYRQYEIINEYRRIVRKAYDGIVYLINCKSFPNRFW